MSSYWAGYSGTALVLTQDEFEAMMGVYKSKNPRDAERILDEYDSLYDCDRANLIRGVFAGRDLRDDHAPEKVPKSLYNRDDSNSQNDKYYFQAVLVDPDDCDGATLTPFYNSNGEKNVYVLDDDGNVVRTQDYTVHLGEPVWAFFSDRDLASVNTLEARPYKGYSELLEEFKNKLAAYLPEDFQWDSHIGHFSYACYA